MYQKPCVRRSCTSRLRIFFTCGCHFQRSPQSFLLLSQKWHPANEASICSISSLTFQKTFEGHGHIIPSTLNPLSQYPQSVELQPQISAQGPCKEPTTVGFLSRPAIEESNPDAPANAEATAVEFAVADLAENGDLLAPNMEQ